jgi:hypothetical protein
MLVQESTDDFVKKDFTETSTVSNLYSSLSGRSLQQSCVIENFGSFTKIDDVKKKNLSSLTTALVVDGICLEEFLKPSMQQSFFDLCSICSAVICSRVSPNQKVVQFVFCVFNILFFFYSPKTI